MQQTIEAPAGFRPAGKVAWVRPGDTPAFAQGGRLKGAKRRGKLFEEHAVEVLEAWTPGFAGLWLEFQDTAGNRRWAQPDWFAVQSDRIVLAEMKLTHTALAWWQMRHLYQPLLEWMFPGMPVARVEVAAKVAGPVFVPEPIKVVHRLDDVRVGQTSFFKCRT